MKFLQKMGRSLMIPVACLPICGILMGLGYLLCPAGMQGGEITGLWARLGYFLCSAGGAVINHMPILFALGIGIGMADGEGLGALAALVSWLMVTTLLSAGVVTELFPTMAENETFMLSISKIDNPFMGILTGLIGAKCILRYKDTRLPPWLSFFSGKRLGIIMAGLLSICVSFLLVILWPLVFSGLVFLGGRIAAMGYFGSALYATLNRLLIPFGLHHALNNVFWFDTIGLGDLTAFWAGKTAEQVGWSLGMYMSGFFPSMMFGVPAAALAMRRSFRREDKQASSMLFSASLSALLCGVTEPFEFLFMFVSPGLYLVYSLLYGLVTYVTNLCGFRAGFSFSGGLIDLIFSASLPAAQRTLLILPIGLGTFALYYLVFRFLIRRFDLPTPGRENNGSEESAGGPAPDPTGENSEEARAAGILRGLGGRDNILSVSHCATRLRLELRDNGLCDDAAIRKAGAVGVMKMGDSSVQVVIGMDVEFVAEELRRQLQRQEADEEPAAGSLPLHGKTGNGGIALGAVFLRGETLRPVKKTVGDPKAEQRRFDGALGQLSRELSAAIGSADRKAAEILNAQRLMLEDEALLQRIREKIDRGMNAEYAACEAGEEAAAAFDAMQDAYLQTRSADIRHMTDRLSRILMGCEEEKAPEQPCILFAEDLSPEEISALDRNLVLGIVTRRGSANSHTAILAGNYGIPYLFSVDFDRTQVAAASFAALDAENALCILSPDRETRERLAARKQEEEQALAAAEDYRGGIRLYANIAGPEDVRAALNSGAEGIGLYRTEFLYMNRSTLPDEEEQFCAYKSVLEAMDGREVIIRTMDIGADKQTDCLPLEPEDNPALGRRAIRICLDDTALFRTQLRALLRAAVYGNAQIMYPMIASPEELDAIREQVALAARELDARGETYRIPPQGIMIETPAAAMISDKLAEKADFFSIGTNDLTQYTLALDRQARGLDRFYDPHHEAVLRLMELTVKNAHAKGIPVGVCGELGGDPTMLPRLRDMGIDELSMSPGKIRRIRSLLSSLPEKSRALPTEEETGVYEEFCSPADGILLPMEEIPDEAFAGGMLGRCVGVIPENGNIYAPCNGTVTMVAETRHAIGIRSEAGRSVLIHVGINTVTLQGEGFTCHVREGDSVKTGDPLMTADLEIIQRAGLDPTVILAVEE